MLQALEQIRRMRGGAQSHLMRCSDGNYYVVKFQNNPRHPRILVNEMLGTRLASKAVRVSEFTFPGDPMRVDYGYRKNGTRGFVRTLSVSRAPADCKLFAYTADRIAKHVQSEFTAVTDIPLQPEHNERHRFVRDTLRDANIQFLDMSAFAAWVPKLKAQLQ